MSLPESAQAERSSFEAGEAADARALDEAMARVLAAERDARFAVEECTREAERLLAQARAREKAIAAAAARRAAAVRAAMRRRLEQKLAAIAALEREAGMAGEAGADEDRRLLEAIGRLAVELTT
ncbi:MAG TPA: hypothetical protein VEG27_10285 [Usitatibacter sp.]|nr:hypothetical protein [Usitatibacter sp.]